MENIIYNAVLLLISIGGFLLGKFIFPNVPKSVADKLRQLAAWADKFVVWAREFRKQDSQNSTWIHPCRYIKVHLYP